VKEEIVKESIVRKMTPPKPEKKEVTPLTEAEVEVIMAALNRSKSTLETVNIYLKLA
jgi:hypothetical protein